MGKSRFGWCFSCRSGGVAYRRKKERKGAVHLYLLSPETVPIQLILFQNNHLIWKKPSSATPNLEPILPPTHNGLVVV